jgi:Putative beta-barrel porin 2
MRWTRPVSILTSLACLAQIGAEDLVQDSPAKTGAQDAPPVQIKDFFVKPMANLSYLNNTLTVDPKVLVGIGYDSNIFSVPSDVTRNSDGFYVGLVGLTLRDRLNDHNKLVIDGEFETDRFFDSKNNQGDLSGGHARADYYWTDKQADEIHAEGQYQKFRDPLVETGETILRQNTDASLYGTWNGPKSRVVVGGSFLRTDYLQDSLFFNASARSNDMYEGDIRAGYAPAKESFYYVLLAAKGTKYDHNTEFNNSGGFVAALGVQKLLAPKTSLLIEVGAEHKTYTNDFNADPEYNDKTVTKPYGNLFLNWKWEEGSNVGIRGFSTLGDSLTANSAWIYGGDIEARYRLAARVALFGSVTAYDWKDDGHAVGVETNKRTTEVVEVGAEYVLRRGLVTRVKGDYTNSKDNLENTFHRIVGIWEIAAAF